MLASPDSPAVHLLARRFVDASCSEEELGEVTVAVTLVLATAGLTLPQVMRRLLEALLRAGAVEGPGMPVEERARRMARVVSLAQQTFVEATRAPAPEQRLSRTA